MKSAKMETLTTLMDETLTEWLKMVGHEAMMLKIHLQLEQEFEETYLEWKMKLEMMEIKQII